MTHDEFLKLYPKPWTFEQTDPDGGGVVLDANGQLLVRLCPDEDWIETVERYQHEGREGFMPSDEERKQRPAFNDEENHSPLIEILLGDE
jgi:hypothetical protein